MVCNRMTLSSALLLAGMLLLPRTVLAGRTTCLTGTDPTVAGDAEQLQALRDAARSACPCASYDGTGGKTRADYRNCTKAVIAATTTPPSGTLRPQCRGVAKKFFANATCGIDPSLHAHPCIEKNTMNGKVTCRVRSQTAKDGSTPTLACVTSDKATKDSCADHSSCIDSADVNDDLLIAAPGDDGHCRRMDCDAQFGHDWARCDAHTAPCAQECVDHNDLSSCHDGCRYGLQECRSIATQTRDACAADPAPGCDAVRTGTLNLCAATVVVNHGDESMTVSVFERPCHNTFFFDPYCAAASTTFFGSTCPAGAEQAWTECRGME